MAIIPEFYINKDVYTVCIVVVVVMSDFIKI